MSKTRPALECNWCTAGSLIFDHHANAQRFLVEHFVGHGYLYRPVGTRAQCITNKTYNDALQDKAFYARQLKRCCCIGKLQPVASCRAADGPAVSAPKFFNSMSVIMIA